MAVLVDALAALATRIGEEFAKFREDGAMIWQTYGLHAQGIGQQDIGWVVPYDMVIISARYWSKAAGTGGTCTAELRRNGTATGDAIAGSSGTPAPSSPTAATPNAAVSAGDRIWIYQTAANTAPGAQLAAEIRWRRA
ncbi:hypothetical protein [Nocardia sp. CA-290969]|uniref:hypothetical protein n=1 Tax=Nocardia sp. CA-290969 TaxID=3239986 RepID=UPI003D8F6C7A